MQDIIDEISQLQSKVSRNEKMIREKRMEKIQLEQKVSKMKERRDEMRERRKEISIEKRSLERMIAKANNRMEEIEQIEKNLTPGLKEKEEEINNFETSIRSLDEDIFKIKGDNMMLSTQLRKLRRERAKMEKASY